MAIPVTLVPTALSAIRSLVLLRKRVRDIRDTSRSNDPLPLLLPPLPANQLRNQTADPGRMHAAFASDPVFRDALNMRGLLDAFNAFDQNIDPLTDAELTAERHSEMFWSFMGLYYQIVDQSTDAPTASVEVDETGLDRFLIQSAQSPKRAEGLAVLRATADTLVEFLGDAAPTFLSSTPNKLILTTILREFATRSDLEQDRPKRLLRVLIGSVATAASAHGHRVSDAPAAALLFASLGRLRDEKGDDFVAHIVSHSGFTTILKDWMARLPDGSALAAVLSDLEDLSDGHVDPTQLPRRLRTKIAALQSTLSVIGTHVKKGQALSKEAIFRDVSSAVLTGVSERTGSFLRDELAGDQFMAELLQISIPQLGQTSAVANNALIAPVFQSVLAEMADVVPNLGQEGALSHAETTIRDLAFHIQSEGVRKSLADLRDIDGDAAAQQLMLEFFAKLRARAGTALSSGLQKQHQIAARLLEQIPDLMRHGIDRQAAVALAERLGAEVFDTDLLESAFVLKVLPELTKLVENLREGRPAVDPAEITNGIERLSEQLIRDLPVWQALENAQHARLLLETVRALLSDESIPPHVSAATKVDIALSVLGSIGRHGKTLSTFLDQHSSLKEGANALKRELFSQHMEAITAKLGHGVAVDDIARLMRRTLQDTLSGADLELPTPQDVQDRVERHITSLILEAT